jgi:hypothetical protein
MAKHIPSEKRGNPTALRLPFPLPVIQSKSKKKKCCKKYKKGKACKSCPKN